MIPLRQTPSASKAGNISRCALAFTSRRTKLRAHAEFEHAQPAADTNTPSCSTNATVKPYPLDYCIVSGDKFGGDMGKPIVTVYKGQEIKFCCKDCPPDFKKNPEKYMKKLAEAEAKMQKEKK